MAAIQRLIWLDDLWTQYLSNASHIRDTDAQALGRIAAEIKSLATHASEEARRLSDGFESDSAAWERAMADAVAGGPLSEAQRTCLQNKVGMYGNFTAWVIAAAAELASGVASAEAELNAKIAIAATGKRSTRDLLRGLRCTLQFFNLIDALVADNPAAGRILDEMIRDGCL